MQQCCAAIMVLCQQSSTSSQKGKEFIWSFCCPRGSEFEIALQFPSVVIHQKRTAKESVDSKAMQAGTSTSGDSKASTQKAGPLPGYESPSFPFHCFFFLGFLRVLQCQPVVGEEKTALYGF